MRPEGREGGSNGAREEYSAERRALSSLPGLRSAVLPPPVGIAVVRLRSAQWPSAVMRRALRLNWGAGMTYSRPRTEYVNAWGTFRSLDGGAIKQECVA